MKILVEEVLIARNKPLAATPPRKGSKSTLTDVQLEVLISVAEGLSTLEIAARRGVSPKAIEAMQALAQQISYYELRLPEPFQVLDFLREELAAEAALQEATEAEQESPTPLPGVSNP